MNYYPIYLDLKGRTVLLIGGGDVALQKIKALLDAGARVRLVSPEGNGAFQQLALEKKIRWARRAYRASDLKGARLVIAATDNPKEQKRISKDCRARGIWANIVDVTPLCDFIAPAVVRRGDIQIAISTGGAAPAFAKYLRQKLEQLVGPEHEAFIAMVKEARPKILKLAKEKRRALWERLVNDSFFQDIRSKGIPQARKYLDQWIGRA